MNESMKNNIMALQADIDRQKQEEAELRAEEDRVNSTLTEEEKEILAKAQQDDIVVINEETPAGSTSQTPISEYAAPLDSNVETIGDKNDVLKTINSGDIIQSVKSEQTKLLNQARKALNEVAISDVDITDEELRELNDDVLRAIKEELHIDKYNSDEISKALNKYSLSNLVRFLPERYVSLYVTKGEIKANSVRAKDRLCAAINFLIIAGPEVDYLNEYISNEQRIITVTEQLMKCNVDLAEMLKDKKRISEIAEKARLISPQDDSIWSKYIKNDPKRLHNEFAQKAVIFQEYSKAYGKIKEEYKDQPDALEVIQEQIDECDKKASVYIDVCNFELFKSLFDILNIRLRSGTGKKAGPKYIMDEAFSSFERIRKSKQSVSFPIYDADKARNPLVLFKQYVLQYPIAIMQYNDTIRSILNKVPPEGMELVEATGVNVLEIDGYKDEEVAYTMSIVLLIIFGRIMKKLGGNRATKYDAIELDAYFICYCKLCTDVYLMQDVWNIVKDLVKFILENWDLKSVKL